MTKSKSHYNVFNSGCLAPTTRNWFGITPLRDIFSSSLSKPIQRAGIAKTPDRSDTSIDEADCEESINASDLEDSSVCTNGTVHACDARFARRRKQEKQRKPVNVSKHQLVSYFEPAHEKSKNFDVKQFLLNCNSRNVEYNFQSPGVDSDMDSSFEVISQRRTQENYSKRHLYHHGINNCSTLSLKPSGELNSIVVHNRSKNKKRKVHMQVCVDDYIDDCSTILTTIKFDDSLAESHKDPALSLDVPKEIFCNNYFWDLAFPGVHI
jgi:hypothetical protein